MLPLEHSAILLTCIKRLLVLKTIFCSFREWPFYTSLLYGVPSVCPGDLFESRNSKALCLSLHNLSQQHMQMEYGAYYFWKSINRYKINYLIWLMSCFCLCSVSLPHGAVGLSAVCDYGISWSYSLFFVVIHNHLF